MSNRRRPTGAVPRQRAPRSDVAMELTPEQWEAVVTAPAGPEYLLCVVEDQGVAAAWGYVNWLTSPAPDLVDEPLDVEP